MFPTIVWRLVQDASRLRTIVMRSAVNVLEIGFFLRLLSLTTGLASISINRFIDNHRGREIGSVLTATGL